MTEEEYGYCSYCYQKKLLGELEQNDGLCSECATMIDNEDMEERIDPKSFLFEFSGISPKSARVL